MKIILFFLLKFHAMKKELLKMSENLFGLSELEFFRSSLDERSQKSLAEAVKKS